MRFLALRRYLARLGSSYWLVPAVMAFTAIVLAGLMILADSVTGSAWMNRFAWLYAARPSGARNILSSIGGSMITVAGTVFSVTIAAVVYASGQYGPRLLTNFMKDRGNQVTLGTFIATFLYCLVVLRTIRSADESNGYSFVPNMALLVAVALALCSIAVLIYFIHHVPSKIHINSVIEEIGSKLVDEIQKRFPKHVGAPLKRDDEDGDGDGDGARMPAAFRRDATADEAAERSEIGAAATGYIQTIDDARLMMLATRHDLVLRLQYQPGDFARAGRTIVEAWPPARCTDEAGAAIAACFTMGRARSTLQDIRFPIDELVEIAARALSPGVNNPFTTLTCLEWLGVALADLSTRELPTHLRVDDEGDLRVIAHPQRFANFCDRAFGALAPYCAGDMIASLRFLTVLGEVALDCDDPDRLATLVGHADRIRDLAKRALAGYPLDRVIDRADELSRALAEPDYKRQLRDGTAWLGGAA